MPPASPAHADPGLIEAIYRCVLEPEGWPDVMALLEQALPSSAQTFYFLQRDTGQVRPVCLRGIDRGLLRYFDELYFAPDNPCMWVSQQQHRPGVVRTNERLEARLGRAGDLYRSAYYHEWLKPQGLHFMIGNTLVADGGLVGNITLMRGADMSTFSAVEVRRFERLTAHMQRALQAGFSVETQAAGHALWAGLAALPGPVALVTPQLDLRFANPAMEALLRRCGALTLRDGRLGAIDAGGQLRLAQAVRAAIDAPVAPVWLPGPADGVDLLLDVSRVALRPGCYLPLRPLVLLAVRRSAVTPQELQQVLREAHGCTRSEAALAAQLAHGRALGDAAAALGITYGSARTYLKALFLKLEVHTQAQLVALLGRLGQA